MAWRGSLHSLPRYLIPLGLFGLGMDLFHIQIRLRDRVEGGLSLSLNWTLHWFL